MKVTNVTEFFLWNDFKMQLLTVSLQPLHHRSLSQSIQWVRRTVVAAELWMKCMKLLLKLCIRLRLVTDHQHSSHLSEGS